MNTENARCLRSNLKAKKNDYKYIQLYRKVEFCTCFAHSLYREHTSTYYCLFAEFNRVEFNKVQKENP